MANRHVQLETPLAEGKLLFQRMTAADELGRMFHIDLELLSNDNDIKLEDVLGKPFSITVESRTGKEKVFHGIASEFSHVGVDGGFARYTATLRPWLWLLTRTTNCRIFQEMKVPDIIKEVFRDHGFTDFEDSLSGSYSERVYCVQYRETDFNFVSRLMEREGIYYYFKFEKGKHSLVLADAYGAHENASGYAKVPYFPPDEHGRRKEEHLKEVTISQCVQPGKYKVNSFDFEKPKADLLGDAVEKRQHDHADYEIYDYPGDYAEASIGQDYAKLRLEGHQARHETLTGGGDAIGLGTGNLFTLEEHPRVALNQEYLILSSTHDVAMHGYDSGGPELRMEDAVHFEAMQATHPFRLEELTPKPTIFGPQTAVVVGKSGEEIWTDEHGRVKVQFPWDREGANDEKSSCWLRVSQALAGKNWGWISIPRIGQEVIVSFMNGDPDQPLVTGRVYNRDNKVPYDLPGNQTQSGLKSRSTKSGSAENFNELRFEDKKGEEQVYFHAEKDFERYVENDDSLTVEKGEQTIEIQTGDRTITIGQGSDELEISQGDRKTTLKMGDRTTKLDLGKDSTEAMQSIELKVGSNSIKIDQSGITIKGIMIKIEGSAMSEMKAPMTTIKGDGMLTVKGGITMIN